MQAFAYPWGVLVESPSPEGAGEFLRSLGDDKLLDASLLTDHELFLVGYVADRYPEVIRAFHAELLARRGLLFTPGSCISPLG